MKLSYSLIAALGILLCCTSSTNSQSPYIEYQEGTVPIIITSGHGGAEIPDGMPIRVHGCWDGSSCTWNNPNSCGNSEHCEAVTVTDGYTIELTRQIVKTIEEELGEGKRPYMVINNIKRDRLDPNADDGIEAAAQGNPTGIEAWNTYFDYIEMAQLQMGRGVLFDIHQQANRPCTEIGYLLTIDDLMNENYDIDKTGIRLLGIETQQSGEELIMGPDSFGAYLTNRGVGQGACSIPSPNNAYPGSGESCWVDGCVPCDCKNWDGSCPPDGTGDNICDYFRGGYTTYTYGSRDGGLCDAFQLETRMPDFSHNSCEPNCEDAPDFYIEDGRNFGKAIVDFYLKYYA